MAPLQAIEWEDCLLEPVRNPQAERYVRRTLRMVPHAARFFLDSPWIVRAVVRFDLSQVRLAYVRPDLAELIALVVSQENACRYCYAATRSVLKILGLPEERIRRLEDDMLLADLGRPEKAALEFARRVSRATPLASGLDAEPLLEAGYGVDAIKEITFLAALNVYYNRIATLPALPTAPMEELAEHWYMKMLRPLAARFLRARRKPGRPERLSEEHRTGPFAEFVLALDGLPAAAPLRLLIDDALSSPVLSRRAKALVFAVVGRGLACPVSEREAYRLLQEEGLRPEQVDTILANLSSAELDPVERVIVPFARETIWYRPVQVQRRAREIRERLSREQFIELIGVAALANAICRLSAAIDLARNSPPTTVQ